MSHCMTKHYEEGERKLQENDTIIEVQETIDDNRNRRTRNYKSITLSTVKG